MYKIGVDSMLMSIVLPVYNRKKYIRRCLNSVLAQSLSDFELIIIDDGSNDGTEKICKEYENKNKKIKLIQQKNFGVSRARNEAIKYAHGKFITFIDSDDFIPKGYIQAIKLAYDKFGPEFLICTSFKMYTGDGIQYFRYNNDVYYSSICGSGVFDIMKSALFNSVVNKVYDLSVIKEFDIKFPEKISLGEDLIFNLRYLDQMKIFRFLLLNKVYYYGWRRERNCSLERKWREDYFEIQQILLQEKLKYLKKWIKDKKIPAVSKDVYSEWYFNCITESLTYYFKHRTCTGFLSMIKKLLQILRSEEYVKYKQFVRKRKLRFLGLCWHNYNSTKISKTKK